MLKLVTIGEGTTEIQKIGHSQRVITAIDVQGTMTKRSLSSVIAILSSSREQPDSFTRSSGSNIFLSFSVIPRMLISGARNIHGGLAIGATLWGRRADRTTKPLRVYALLEIAIAIYCILYPVLLSFVKRVFIGIVVASDLPSDSTGVLFLKLLASLSTLLLLPS